MNSSELEILVKIRDEASEGLKRLAANAEQSGKTISTSFKMSSLDFEGFSKVAATAGLAATATIGAFLVSTVKDAQKAQVAIAKMDSTLRTMGEAAMGNRDAILAAADASVKLGFDDEDSALSITKFYQRTKDLTTAMTLNHTAMDLARAKSIDLSTATDLVNLALSGSGRALLAYGIHIKDAATPLEALRELQGQVAGQADSFAHTFEGQMEVVSTAFTNFKETIGSALIDSLMPFILQFNAWLLDPNTKESFKQWTASFKEWADVLIPTVIDVFKLWGSTLSGAYNLLVNIEVKIIEIIDATQRLAQMAHTAGSGIIGGVANIGAAIGSGFRASGGPVSAGMPYIVGERGPELFVPSMSGGIVPNGGGMGAGGVMVNISGNFYGTDQQAALKFGDIIAKIIGQQLKIRSI